MNDSEPKADGLNYCETKTDVITSCVGTSPNRSIRKRGKHRARRRKETYIILEDLLINMYKKIEEDLFKPSPLMKIIGLAELLISEANEGNNE
jgi:hypothetical protein